MSEEHRRDQRLSDYLQPRRPDTWQCLTCGKSSGDRDEIERCHPLVGPSVTEATEDASYAIGSQFLYPVSLPPRLVEYFEDLKRALREETGQHPLRTAASVVREHIDLREDLEAAEAFTLFTHLVCLQNLGLLPGYPRYTHTISDDDYARPIPLQEFCSTHDNGDGVVTDERISESNLITTDRVYRSKVLSVTGSFWSRTSLVDTRSPWKWITYSSTTFPDRGYDLTFEDTDFAATIDDIDHSEFEATAVFDDSTAHNVVVSELRNWLLTRSDIDWASAPYVERAPAGFIGRDGLAIQSHDEDPVWMHDVAGFDAETRLRVLGSVIEDEEFEEVFDLIKRIQKRGVSGYVVMRNRDSIHDFLSHGSSAGWFSSESTPIDHLSRRPSLEAVNQVVDEEIPALSDVRFLTRKKLIDQLHVPRDPSTTTSS